MLPLTEAHSVSDSFLSAEALVFSWWLLEVSATETKSPVSSSSDETTINLDQNSDFCSSRLLFLSSLDVAHLDTGEMQFCHASNKTPTTN